MATTPPLDHARPEAAALSLDGVTRTFGQTTALDGLTLSIATGEVVGLLGHNGAGKTTTVRLLAGLLSPDRGTVRVGGVDPVADGVGVRRRLGVLPARPIVDDRLTAVQNLQFAADVFGVSDLDAAGDRAGVDRRIAERLSAFGLDGRGHEAVAGFSTGMRQRLSLARVLLPDPDILLLDEPTAALDPVAGRQVRQVLADLARDRDRTVVICTHDLDEAEQLCDRVVVLEHGRVVAEGSPAQLAAQHGAGGLLVEVDPAAAHVAATALASCHAGPVTTEGGGRLRLTGIPRERVPELLRRLLDDGVEVFQARRLDPTLEEVYLALHDATPTSSAAATGERP